MNLSSGESACCFCMECVTCRRCRLKDLVSHHQDIWEKDLLRLILSIFLCCFWGLTCWVSLSLLDPRMISFHVKVLLCCYSLFRWRFQKWDGTYLINRSFLSIGLSWISNQNRMCPLLPGNYSKFSTWHFEYTPILFSYLLLFPICRCFSCCSDWHF